MAQGWFPTHMSEWLIEQKKDLLLEAIPLRRFGSEADFWTMSQGAYAVGHCALAPARLFIQAYAEYGFRYNFMGKEGIRRMDPTETRIADQSLVTG